MISIFIKVRGDNYDSCGLWASEGECETYAEFMLKHCRRACKVYAQTSEPSIQLTELTTAAGKT